MLKKFNSSTYVVLGLTLALSIFGLFMVYSASRYTAMTINHDEFFYLKKQLLGFGVGVVALVFFTFFDHRLLKKFALPSVVVSVVLLVLVFVPVIGVEKYGAKRWINLGVFTLQSSEVAKLSFIIFTANVLSNKKRDENGLFDKWQILAVGAVFLGLILIEPNLSMTICVAVLMVVMLILGGLHVKYILMFMGLSFLALVMLILLEPYRLLRLMAFINPWASPKGEGYQLIQSLYAIANGGLFGVGYLQSRQALRFLTFAESDFIFSIILEEFGLFGGVVLMLSFFMLFREGIRIATNCNDRFSMYLACGISVLLAVQTLINFAVVTGSIPPTGLPLPLISSGNTQIIVYMSNFGIIANISITSYEQNNFHFHTIKV